MRHEFNIIIEQGDQYYFGYCPEIPGANGQGETIEECKDNVREAVALLLRDRLADGLRGAPEDAIRETVILN